MSAAGRCSDAGVPWEGSVSVASMEEGEAIRFRPVRDELPAMIPERWRPHKVHFEKIHVGRAESGSESWAGSVTLG